LNLRNCLLIFKKIKIALKNGWIDEGILDSPI
jgi:hypothetical protein